MSNDNYMVVNIRDYLQKGQKDVAREEILLETIQHI